ncbi:MAG: hypothetical protein BWY31_02395 [Lentisphaerae bacterium ADurb.Bin242]|nr:MAG: hypothetical protein BWY31_02395 [Lentisphaerae bacterium ADurb.Bin242]
MNAFDYKQMRAVSMADAEEVKKALARADFPSCEYSFPNLFIWAEVFRTCLAFFNDRLYVHMPLVDELLFPCGETWPSPEELKAVSEGMRKAGFSGTVAHVPAAYLEQHPEITEFFSIRPMDDANDEYIYCTAVLAELHGSKLSKKRNLISQFERNHEQYEIRAVTSDDFRTLISLTEHWRRDHLDDQRVENERCALSRALKYYNELGFEGLMLLAEGEIKAYAVFSRLNSQSYTVQFEKALHECKGASQVITNRTAVHLRDKCKFINREQDLGIPGLRQAKLSYVPDHLLKDFFLIPQE